MTRRTVLTLLASASPLGAQAAPRFGDAAPGRFLVARRDLPDPNFAQSVVLLTSFSRGGAMGVIVNRSSEVRVSRLIPSVKSAAMLFEGGPVSRGLAVALVRLKDAPEGAVQVVSDIYLLTDKAFLEKSLNAGMGDDRLRIYVGYAGWSPGQLEKEILAGSWHIMPSTPSLVFDQEPDSLYDRLMRRTDTRIA